MKKQKKKRSGKNRIYALLKLQIALMLILIAGVAYYYVGGYASTIENLKKEAGRLVRQSTEATFRQAETSMAYYANGDTISELRGEKDVYYLKYDEIEEDVCKALISIEDKKFYSHKGVDYRAIIRAAWAALQNGEVTQGGSTITQQLARNIFLTNEKTWQRKAEEIFIATELEKKYSKNKILEFYLNNVYFANGYYGIQAAAQGYFSKDLEELTLAQICYLLAIPNSPSYYDPVKNPDNTLERRNKILDAMYSDGKISKAVLIQARNEDISLNRKVDSRNNNVETYVYYCATRILMELDGFEFIEDFTTDEYKEAYEKQYDQAYDQWNEALFTGGYRIYTSFDPVMQQQLQDAIDRNLAEYTDKNDHGIYALQSAAVCIDNDTGMVAAMVGGRSQDMYKVTLNRAYQSFRQPGSAIKPLLVYAPAMEKLGYTPDSIVIDEKIEDGPSNADKTYEGEITLQEAVMKSKNTIAWKLYEELTPQIGMKYLKNLVFSKITKDDYGMAACLGGFTIGVSPLEMARGYAALENDGYDREPGCITKITDAKGNVLFEAKQEAEKIYEENITRYTTSMLQSVITDGTAKSLEMGDIPYAGKTGTTNDNRDGWFVGYSRYYTTSVWVGYDTPKRLPGLSGSSYPAYIWQDFMNAIHEEKVPLAFKEAIADEATDNIITGTTE